MRRLINNENNWDLQPLLQHYNILIQEGFRSILLQTTNYCTLTDIMYILSSQGYLMEACKQTKGSFFCPYIAHSCKSLLSHFIPTQWLFNNSRQLCAEHVAAFKPCSGKLQGFRHDQKAGVCTGDLQTTVAEP